VSGLDAVNQVSSDLFCVSDDPANFTNIDRSLVDCFDNEIESLVAFLVRFVPSDHSCSCFFCTGDIEKILILKISEHE